MTRRVLIFAVLAAAVLGAAPASQAVSVNARERAEQARLRRGLPRGRSPGASTCGWKRRRRASAPRSPGIGRMTACSVLASGADLQRDLAIESRRIAQQKHDGQVR
jgi:hypothetical protein